MSYLFVYSTAKDEVEAASLAKSMVEQRLAACANIVPGMRSFYRWQGAVQNEREVVIIFKTKSSAFDALQKAFKAEHSYDCPCIIAMPITAAYQPYLDWIGANVD